MQFDVFLTDASTGAQLEGASVDVFGPDGKKLRSINKSETFGDCDVRYGSFERSISSEMPIEDHEDNEFDGYALAPGTYRFVERAAPPPPELRMPHAERSEKGLRGILAPLLDPDFDASESAESAFEEAGYFEYAKAPELFVELGDAETGKVVIAHERIKPGQAGPAWLHLPSRRSLLTLVWLAAVAAIVALLAWLAAPAIWMTIFGLASCATPGFGISFAFGNLADYAAAYLIDGWRAVSILSNAYAASPLILWVTWALTALAALLIAHRFDQWFTRATAPKNELLDSLPPAAGHNECGSAKIIQDTKSIERSFDTCREDDMSLDYSGVVMGCIDESFATTGARMCAHAATMAAWAVDSAIARVRSEQRKPRPTYAGVSRKFVYSAEDENAMVIADTRAGKTRRCLIPTIDLLARSARESIVAIDPKGELYGLTSDGAAKTTESVICINFRDPLHSHRHNFMQLVVTAMRESNWEEADKAASDLVEQLLPKTLDVGQTTYFNQGARSYIKSAVLWTASWNTVPDDQRNLTTVSRMIGKYGTARPVDQERPQGEHYVPWLMMLESLPRNHPAREAFDPVAEVVDKERMAFVTTAQTVLRDFRDSNIAAMTSVTDFDPRRIGLEKAAVYIIIPVEKATYGMFATLLLQQFYQALVTEGTKHGGRLPFRANFLCEEFGQIPPVPELDQKMNSSLSIGIRWVLILQSMAQLSLKYDRDTANAIIPACELKLLIKTTDHSETGKWFSEHIGNYTIATESASISGKRITLFRDSASTSVRLSTRPRLFPDEVCRWRANWGSLVTHGATEGAGYVIPLPDVSELYTTQRFDLGTPEHNRAKMERVLFCEDLAVSKPAQPYYPELTKMRERKTPYSDEELREAEVKWFAALVRRYKSLKAPSKSRAAQASPMPTQRENAYGCLLSPDRTQRTMTVRIGSELDAQKELFPGWSAVERMTVNDVENSVRQMMSMAIPGIMAKAAGRPPAQGPAPSPLKPGSPKDTAHSAKPWKLVDSPGEPRL